MEQTSGLVLKYRVTWTRDGGEKMRQDFWSRKGAIALLNTLVLDCGYADVKLRNIPKAQQKRVAF